MKRAGFARRQCCHPPQFGHASPFHNGFAIAHHSGSLVVVDGNITRIDDSNAPEDLRYEGDFHDGLAPKRAQHAVALARR